MAEFRNAARLSWVCIYTSYTTRRKLALLSPDCELCIMRCLEGKNPLIFDTKRKPTWGMQGMLRLYEGRYILPTWKSLFPGAMRHIRVSDNVSFSKLWLYFATQRISVRTLWERASSRRFHGEPPLLALFLPLQDQFRWNRFAYVENVKLFDRGSNSTTGIVQCLFLPYYAGQINLTRYSFKKDITYFTLKCCLVLLDNVTQNMPRGASVEIQKWT